MAGYISYKSCFVTKTREEEEEDERAFQRYDTLISTLPKEEGWMFENHLCQYQNFWFPDLYCRAVMAIKDHFKALSTDIFFASTPKSGATWIKALLFSTVTRGMYSNHNHPLLTNNPHDLVPFMDLRLYSKRILPDLEILPSPRLLGAHMPYSSLPPSVVHSSCRIVYVCRNPKDVFVSFWQFTNKIRDQLSKPPLTVMDAFERFCKGNSHFGPFWDHVLGYWKASLERPGQVLFLKFEEVKENPILHLKRLAHFVGFPFTSQEMEEGVVDEILKLCSFENLSNLEVNKTGKTPMNLGNDIYFRKGEVGDWENHLTSEMIQQLDQITEEKFHGSGLKL